MKKFSALLFTLCISVIGFNQNDFAFKLFEQLDEDKNLLFSPTSIKTAFAMVYDGANGGCQAEIEKVFGFSEDNSAFMSELERLKKVAKISNSIWIQTKYKVLQTYIDQVQKCYQAEPYNTDFLGDSEGSADRINKWIEKSTNGMIKRMVTPQAINNFKLALVNAIYFKEDWKIPFNKALTKKEIFYNYDGSESKIDLMHSRNNFKAYEGAKEQIIELAYEDEKTAMVILLPHKMKNYKLDNECYTSLTQKMYSQRVNFMLPKFEFETPTFELKPYLQKLGIAQSFTNGADFSKMRKQRDLKIGTVLHKAKIIVNEEGTEAAAATVIGMVQTTSANTAPIRIMEMRVDKPFYYFIKDNETGAILFMGKMNTAEE